MNKPTDINYLTHAIQKSGGFTLLEILVVITIGVILFSMSTLAIRTSSPEELLQLEAQRFNRLIQLTLEESVLRGVDYGLMFEDEGYQFLLQTNEGWQVLKDDKLLRPRELPENMELELEIEETAVAIDTSFSLGRKFELELEENRTEKEEELKPQVFLLSSEEITPEFSVRFALPGVDTSYIVSGFFDGKHKFEKDER